MKIICFLSLILYPKFCENANILAIAPFGGKSHYNLLEILLTELSAKNHNIDVVSHFPSKKQIPRYNDLSVRGTLPIFQNNMTIQSMIKANPLGQIKLMIDYGGPKLCKAVLNSETMHNLKNTTKKYDLLLVHYLATNCMLGFGHHFNIPTVVVTTSVNLPWTSSFIGLPDNPSYIPNYFTSYLPKMPLMHRIVNTLVYISSKIGFELLSNKESNVIAKKFFGPDLPNLDDLAKNISLVLVNSHFSVHQSRPVVPNFVEIAGAHINENTTLPKYFEESLETDTKGIIYLSFGSMLLSESLPEDKLKAFFNTFKQLPYKIMWKGSREKFPSHLDIPKNIQFEPWMPQLGILCHPNVKLFVSHGGMLGTLEALYCGIPVLGIPIFADQSLNIKNSVNKGVAIEVPYNDVSEDTLMSALKLLLDDPTYKENAKKSSKLFKDRPNSALETAVYWIEYVIRHNGAPHLRSIGADLPWYQYYLVDVIGILLMLGVIIVLAIYTLLIFICRRIILHRKEQKAKPE